MGKEKNPDSPKRNEYEDDKTYRRDYAKYMYLKKAGRLSEFKKNKVSLTDLSKIKPIANLDEPIKLEEDRVSLEGSETIFKLLSEIKERLTKETEKIQEIKLLLIKIFDN